MNFLKSAALGMSSQTAGVRPEQLQFVEGPGAIRSTVSHVERLGGETLVYLHTADHGLLTARLFGEHDFAVGSERGITFAPDRVFHFDEAGQRLR